MTIQKASSSPGSHGEGSRPGSELNRSGSPRDSPSGSSESSSIRSHDWFSDDSLQFEIDEDQVYKDSLRLNSAEEGNEASLRSAGSGDEVELDQAHNLTASQRDKRHMQRLLADGPKQQAIGKGLDHCMAQANDRKEERRSLAAIDKP